LVSSSLIAATANQLVRTEIALEAMESSGGELVIDFSASQGLSMENMRTPQTIKFAGSAPIKIPVVLRAASNGRYYLNMHISLNNADAISARNLALIVQVGPVVEKAVKLQKTTGDNIIVLPAQETISSQ
jgi:predicted FMN-binding regulatory protein PaiB